MKMESTRLGTIEIEKDKIITFPQGIPGFQDEKEFVIVPAGKEDNPFYFLQSVANAELSFILTEPHSFYSDYDFKLSEEVINQLEIEKPEDVIIYSIVTMKDELKKATTNLQAPVVINASNRKAKQFIISEGKYVTRQPLFPQEAIASKQVAATTEAAKPKEG